jgi:TonB-dependent receptor-like protein
MNVTTQRASVRSIRRDLLIVAAVVVLLPQMAAAQPWLRGELIATVKNEQGDNLAGAEISLTSPALLGGPLKRSTDVKGQVRFRELPEGLYVLDITYKGFGAYHEEALVITAGRSITRHATASNAQRVDVEAPTFLDPRPGVTTHSGPEYLTGIPNRQNMFAPIMAAPGISGTAPSNGFVTTFSNFGSGTNENQTHTNGNNTNCPCSGVARTELAPGFIEGVQVQSVGASAEFGSMMGAVVNFTTRSGSERLLADVVYYGQAAALTGQPVRLPYLGSDQESGFGRSRYLDLTTTLGGPVVRDRLRFFFGYQHLRDHDSQPGTDPDFPRTLEMEKFLGRLTWQLSPTLQLDQSLHYEIGINPDRPTTVTPFEATRRQHISVPTITFGHLTHTPSANTLWDVRVGRFVYTREDTPNSGDPKTIPSVFDRATGVTSGATSRFVSPLIIKRTTGKATLTHYRPDFLGGAHEWKVGGQFERGEHSSFLVTPTGTRYELRSGVPLQAISTPPSNVGGLSITASAFAADTIPVGDRLTLYVGVRFDHSRAISQDLPARDPDGRETGEILRGLGTLYTWNHVSPRFGISANLTADGRTMLRMTGGRYYQGVLTGELELFHPGAAATTMTAFDPATGGYTGTSRTVDPKINVQFDPDMRAPRTDEYSIGVERAFGDRLSVGMAYVHKHARQIIGWEDVAGQYIEGTQILADGSSVPVYRLDTLVTPPVDRRFRLMNPDGYSMTYNGVVVTVEKRRSHGWQASGSYTGSKAYGLLPSSGMSASGAQVSTVGPPDALTFGRDPNDLTNARGLLPNDRPHMFKVIGSADVPRTGVVIAASFQYFTGKPWAAATQLTLPQGEQRVQLESRGSRRLSSQELLDLRVSRPFHIGATRIELFVDVLNLLNDTAEEGLATETKVTTTTASIPTFGQPVSFVDPRRAMFGVRVNLGR